MKYKLLRFSLLSMLVMLFGGGIYAVTNALMDASAAEPEVTLDFTTNDEWNLPTTNTTTANTYTNADGYAITLGHGGVGNGYKYNTGYLIFGQTGSYLTLPAFDFDVEKIVVTGRSGASTAVGMNIYVGDKEASTATTGCTGTNTYEIASNYQAAGTIYTLKVTTKHNAQVTTIEVYKKSDGSDTPTATVAKPEITVEEIQYGSVNVSITCATEGAAIYYTTDGNTPTAESTAYSAPFSLNETATVKAIAIKDGEASDVETKTATVHPALQTVAELNALANGTKFQWDGNSLLVVAKPSAKYVYVKDETGSSLIYDNSEKKTDAAEVGKFIEPGWKGQVSVYKELFEAVPDAALTVQANREEEVTYPTVDLSYITAEHINEVVKIEGVTYAMNGKNLTITKGDVNVAGYNQMSLEIAEAAEGKSYNIIGAIGRYNNNIQFWPITIEEDAADEPTGFRDIKLDLTQHAELLTESDVYITVAEDGTIGTTTNAEEAAATIKGKVHSNYGSSNFTASVPVEGTVKITYATHDYGNDITVTNDAGEQVAKLNTNGAKWMSDPTNVAVTYYRVNEPTTLHFSNADYNPYFAVEAIDPADLPAEVTNYTVTFAAGEGTGTAPAAIEVEAGSKITAPKNYYLYKEGYTLTGWSDGTKTYAIGEEITPEADMTLTAQFTQNEVSLAERTAAVTITYDLGGYNDNPKYNFQSGDGIIVTQATVNGKSIDVATKTNGKFAHNGSGWHQVNAGTKVTVPSAKGATITVKTYNNANALKFSETAAEAGQDPATFTATAEDATLVIEQTANGYWNKLTITLPAVESEEPGEEPHDPVNLVWDYTENAPSAKPDNGLYYDSNVNDDAGTNLGLHGVKLNSLGWAFFEKPAVAGKLTLTFGNRKSNAAYAVNVYTGTLTDGTPTKGELIGEIAIQEGPGSGSLDIDADVTGIWIERKTSAEGVLQKIAFKEKVARSFVDFKITNEELSGEFDPSTLPAGVTFTGTQRNDSHGYGKVTIVVPVDGTVKFSIGGCQYANPANCKVTNAAGEELATPTLKTDKCYHEDGTVVNYFYVGEPTTLIFSNIAYLPYFKAEATEVQEVTITYKDQNGNTLGKKTVYEGDPIGEIPYTEADLTIDEGYKFRGWVYASGVKVKATDTVDGNKTVSASVTAIETTPEVGSVQTYDLTQATFYPEDHENFNVEGGQYYNNHGFDFAADGKFEVAVGGKAQIVLALCKFGNGTTITVTDAAGNTVATDVPAKADADGGTTAVNYDGEAGMLTFAFAAQSYLHKVTVYNVNDFVEKDDASGYYIVPANDGAGLVLALNAASSEANSKIFLPNGTYDLGESVLTTVSGTNVSLIGESMEGVIIKNTPDVKLEGLKSAATLVNAGSNFYMQDLTLQNALDYYGAGSAGRANAYLEDGNRTVAKNVRLLSYQDTYLSPTDKQQYWENSEIHGCVDFICGGGDVFFESCNLVTESRKQGQKNGEATITAHQPRTAEKFGYVFNNCTIENQAATFNLGRAWGGASGATVRPTVTYLNTTLNQPAEIVATRFLTAGMNNQSGVFHEYNSVDKDGNVVSPASNVQKFTDKNGGDAQEYETILTAEQAANYALDKVFTDWTPAELTKQVEAPTAELKDGTITWSAADGATAYALFKNGELLGITTETSFTPDAITDTEAARRAGSTDTYTIRAANARGGFGEAKTVTVAITDGISAAKNGQQADTIYNMQGVRVSKAQKGVYIVNGHKVVMK